MTSLKKRFIPTMQIDVVWFPREGTGGNKFSEKIVKEPLLEMTIPNKPRSSKQKYQLTEKGLAILASPEERKT